MEEFLTLPIEVLKAVVQLADPSYSFRDNKPLSDRIIEFKNILESLGQ